MRSCCIIEEAGDLSRVVRRRPPQPHPIKRIFAKATATSAQNLLRVYFEMQGGTVSEFEISKFGVVDLTRAEGAPTPDITVYTPGLLAYITFMRLSFTSPL